MTAIIIEDEKPAAEKLLKALTQADASIHCPAILTSCHEATNWLLTNPQPDLLFMDIELTDGLSFKIFEKVQVSSPIIFTTAYDEYWQEAFEYNGIEYLLKPVKQQKLEAALKKYAVLKQHFTMQIQQLMQWQQRVNRVQREYRKRYLVKRGTDYVAIKAEDIAYCYAIQKLVCMVDNRSQKFILDKSLADLEKELDPSLFFRANRKYLVNMSAVRKMKVYPKSKILIELNPSVDEEVIISNENAAAFKEWMGN